MMLRKRNMLLILALITIVSCGGGGGGGGTSSTISTSTPVNMEINLKGDVSKVPVEKIDSSRFTAPQLPDLVKEKFEIYSNMAGYVSYPLSHAETHTFNDGDVVFRIDGVDDIHSLESQVQAEYGSYNLQNLTANMNKGSTLLLIGDSDLSLSKIKEDLFADFSSKPIINGNKNDYNQVMFIDGKFKIDKDINLDSANDMYNRIKIYDSDITNLATIKGTLDNQVGIGQREKVSLVPSTSYPGNKLINKGTINLSGNNSIGIFNTGWKIAGVQNIGDIIVNKNSTGIYVLDKKYYVMQHGTGNIENEGNIQIGENSIGIYYEAEEADEIYKFNAKILNKGAIKSVANGAIGMYHNSFFANKEIKNTGLIELTGDKSTGIFATGTGKYNVENSGKIVIGNSSDKGNPSIGIYTNNGNIILNNTGTINLGQNSIGIYGIEALKKIGDPINGYKPDHYSVINSQSGKIELNGKGATGIYLDNGATGKNEGTITTINADGGSIGVVGIKDSQFTNNGTISVNEGSVGIYGNGDNAVLKNEGTITAGRGSVGMYSAKGATVENNKTIKLTGDDAIGMYLADNSIGINNGEITTDEIVNRAIGAVIGKNAEFTNNGKIVINSNEGTGIVIANGGIIKNYGDIQITGENASREKRVDDIVVKVEGLANTLSSARKTVSPLGIYVDSLGRTKPIEGLANLGLKSADLLIGAEATEKTNDTEVTVGDDVLAPFNNSMQTSNIKNWNVKTGSLVWQANPEILNNKIAKVTLKKLSYTNFADDEMTQDVARGLDEKYKVANSNDKEIFNYLNTVSSKKTFADTYREVSGNQYANVQQRISKTDDILNNRISDLQKENADESGHHVSTFFDKNKHSSKVQGIADSDSSAYGISYLFNNADAKQGIYAGAINNNFKLKDNGRSKENISMLEVGGYKTFDVNNLEWTLDGNGFVSQNNMKRRFVVGNNSYENKANYNAYGVNLTNELGKTFNVGGNFTVKPYAALKLGYGRFNKIKEKDGTLNVEVKANDYYSVRPGAGVEFGFSSPVSAKGTKFKASLGLGYDHELGKVDDRVNEVKFTDTNTRIRLKSAKDEKKGNFRSDLKVGFETGKFDVSVNGGYDTKDKNSHVGVGLGVSF